METERHIIDAIEYPRSYASTSESLINRSRVWSGDITKHWNVPITGIETFSERTQRYLLYFKPTSLQLKRIHERLSKELLVDFNIQNEDLHADPTRQEPNLRFTRALLDKKQIPNGKEKGACYSFDFGGKDPTNIYAALVQLEGNGKASIIETSQDLSKTSSTMSKGYLSPLATASMLFDVFVELLKRLHEKKSSYSNNKKMVVGLSIGFPILQRGIARASLARWTKGFETGRQTIDPVEGVDLDALLDHALSKAKIDAKVTAIVNDAAATLIAGYYETHGQAVEPCVGITVGSGINGCFILPDTQDLGIDSESKESVITCNLGSFDASLPVTDVDVGVDFSDESTGTDIFEKMIAANYLEELCRRLVVKVWQTDAPRLAWTHHSLPWKACVWIIEDNDTSSLTVTNEILLSLWDWETTLEERLALRELFQSVFERSAALTATAIAALAAKTGRLQPAMGGVTCAISGTLYQQCSFYRTALEKYIRSLLPDDMRDCIRLYEPRDAIIKGAAILAFLNRSQK